MTVSSIGTQINLYKDIAVSEKGGRMRSISFFFLHHFRVLSTMFSSCNHEGGKCFLKAQRKKN